MTLEQLKEIQQLSWEWARFAGFGKLSYGKTLIAINKELEEVWESCDNESLQAELADVVIILVRIYSTEFLLKRAIRDSKKNKTITLCTLLCSHKTTLLSHIISYCQQNNIDLYNHCKLKLKYNYSRPEYIAKNKELNK